MIHEHVLYDADPHFIIDRNSRSIVKANGDAKTVIFQHDHYSERFTFELPRYIDGHDMSLCDKVQVHYINTDSSTQGSYKDVDILDDLHVSPDDENVVLCSWLVSSNATQYIGTLSFSLAFRCIDEQGTVIYRWNTGIHNNVSVSKTIDNGESIINEHSDILAEWESKLFEELENKQPKGDYATEEFVIEKVSEAQLGGGSGEAVDLSAYLSKEDAAQTYQPKGEYLTEHQKLKTINGQSLVGEGDIVISGSGETEVQSAYQNVKYLENTGTQYIDTGYVLHEDDVLEVDYEIPETALQIKTDKILIDARDATNGVRISTYSGTYKWYARFGHNESQTSAAITSSLKGTLSLCKGQFVLNGAVVFDSLVFTAMPTGTLKLLSGINHETGAISAPSYARISAAKIKRNGETVRNFRPVQRTADGELGMRDTVTGEFFPNAGTGVFSFAPADYVESTAVQRKPTLTEEQKLALQSLMDDYYNNRGTFYYEFTHNRNAFTSGGQCYTAAKGKFKQCCATFVQNIMMGRSVNDFVGKNASTYSANITKTAVSDFGYYFDFKYRKYLYGLTDTDENGNTVYYGWNQPNEDNYEGSYSYNSYYHPDSTKTYKQNFNGFCNANDMARELYEMGCEVPFSELDVGDIIFTLDNDLSDNSSMLNFHAWRNIYHVGMVYDVKQIDASSKEIYYIECTSYFDVDNRPIEKPFLSSSQMDLRFKAFKLTEDMAFCARMPIAFGYEPNVPDKITTSATP